MSFLVIMNGIVITQQGGQFCHDLKDLKAFVSYAATQLVFLPSKKRPIPAIQA